MAPLSPKKRVSEGYTLMPAMSKTVVTALVLGLALSAWACRQTEPEPEPVSGAVDVAILVTVDGLVPADLRMFGGDVEMPALERVASMGRAWDDAWTAIPMTRPAVATYLTGLAPDRHGVRDDLFSPLSSEPATLATAFAGAGYRTAAFPDSSFLGALSGLHRGFDVVADPLWPATDATRWQPDIRLPDEVAQDFGSWLDTLAEDDRYFAWVHLSGPLVLQMWDLGSEIGLSQDMKRKRAKRPDNSAAQPPGPEDLDAALGSILDHLERRGDLARALIVVAGTQADATGGAEDLAGPGFSIAPGAIRVPVVFGWAGAGKIRAEDEPVWAPDVTATIARAAGLQLAEDAEGVSLLESVPSDRIIIAWSWATLDQMGWRAQRTARAGEILRVEGLEDWTRNLDDPAMEVVEADAARLAEALVSRAEPAAPAVPIDLIRPILEARGLTLNPVPSEGRLFGDPVTRREVSRKLLGARSMIRRQRARPVVRLFEEARVLDPENLGVNLDEGQMVTSRNATRATRLLGRTLELYPTNLELLHWYAHATWGESWQVSEAIIELILPYKPQDSDLLYDLACTRSRSGNLDQSEEFLRRSIDAGFTKFGHMESDPDLRNLREEGRLSKIISEYR